MKTKLAVILSSMFMLFSCAAPLLETASWHTSPSAQCLGTAYTFVQWSVVKKLQPGMTVGEVKSLIRNIEPDKYPTNAIVYSVYENIEYEIALKLSKDKKIIEDISYKPLGKVFY